jgi:hypothetical protein
MKQVTIALPIGYRTEGNGCAEFEDVDCILLHVNEVQLKRIERIYDNIKNLDEDNEGGRIQYICIDIEAETTGSAVYDDGNDIDEPTIVDQYQYTGMRSAEFSGKLFTSGELHIFAESWDDSSQIESESVSIAFLRNALYNES